MIVFIFELVQWRWALNDRLALGYYGHLLVPRVVVLQEVHLELPGGAV
jgi:hypothetical protein